MCGNVKIKIICLLEFEVADEERASIPRAQSVRARAACTLSLTLPNYTETTTYLFIYHYYTIYIVTD